MQTIWLWFALICVHIYNPKAIPKSPLLRGGEGKGREGEDVGVKGKLLSRLLLCECVSLGRRKARVVFLDRL